MTTRKEQKDYGAWRCAIHEYVSVDAAASKDCWADGIHRVFQDGSSLDFLLKGVDRFSDEGERQVLVCFGGAVTDRENKAGPFFSGLQLAEELGLPLLSVDDPSLGLSRGLSLGWYAGCEGMPNLVSLIAQCLDCFADLHRCRLICVGWSGGGFAVASVLARLRADVVGLVWNPQTNISKYQSEAVEAYLSVAFPSVSYCTSQGAADKRPALADALARAGIAYDITELAVAANARLLYLQNFSDWHTSVHASPFLLCGEWVRTSNRSFYSENRGVACWFGDWGEGHIAPPKAVIHSALFHLKNGGSVRDGAALLDSQYAAGNVRLPWFRLDGPPGNVRVNAYRKDGFVEVSTIIDETYPEKSRYEYAYYLCRDGVKCAVHGYGCDERARIDYPADVGDEYVLAFIKDAFGAVVSTRASVISTI